MSTLKDQICQILKVDDPLLTEFIQNIGNQCSSNDEFKKKMLEMDSQLDETIIEQLYNAVNGTASVNDQVRRILQNALSVNDEVVAEFVINTCIKCQDLESFERKLVEMQIALSPDISKRLYEIITHDGGIKKEERQPSQFLNGLAIPDNVVSWDDLTESKRTFIDSLDAEPLVGKVYPGKVKTIARFGCFIRISGIRERNRDGLVHISELSPSRVSCPEDVVCIGQEVFVKVIKIQSNGKISLSMKSVDQNSGKLLGEPSVRGRTRDSKIPKRRLTSPERWEIRQLISSGAASIDDYPELTVNNDSLQENGLRSQSDTLEEEIDVEVNMDDEPAFLRGQYRSHEKYQLPMISKVPKGSLNRSAMNGSETMKQHRDEKLKLIKEAHRKVSSINSSDDPNSKTLSESRFNSKQMLITAWERSKLQEKISYGKRTSLHLKQQRETLPVFKMRDQLITSIRDNQFLVIVGETGSGKTTQITQYLDEEGFSKNGVIGCTQPRRVAAVSVAKRVAEEMGCRIGHEVGYTIRFEDETSSETRIKYLTDGMLQREALLDPLMTKYSVIILDEAHERTIATDVLFALLKRAARHRSDLKIVVTSATLDSDKFSKYFMDCPVVNIPGKTFPVEVMYANSPQMDYIESTLDTVMEIHVNEDEGDILVFLTGQEEIDTCCEILFERAKRLEGSIDELIILPVYSALPSEIQSRIFEPTPKGSRKVIFATNIAETSITIDGIYFVIDPGFSKVNTYNPRAGMEQLIVSPISQAQANQRKGRAGRTGPGKCFRLYTESAFKNEMLPNTVPEIQRQNLELTILMLKAMGINDLINFEFMDPPPKAFMISALEELFNLQALDDNGFLTVLGKRMSQFPMDPSLSKSLLASTSYNCSDEMLTIVSMLSVQNVFYRPKDKQNEADSKKARFHHPFGDHLTLLNVFNRWRESNYSKVFCTTNFLHERHLKRALDVRKQLCNIFNKMRLPICSCHGDLDAIRKSLVSGFFRNVSKRDSQVGYKTITDGTQVAISPGSSLFGKEYDYVIYHNVVLTSREYMVQVTAIEPHWLLELAPHFYKMADANSASRKKAKIEPLNDRFAKDKDAWRLSSIRANRERKLGVRR